jgi:hypothetical protein
LKTSLKKIRFKVTAVNGKLRILSKEATFDVFGAFTVAEAGKSIRMLALHS